MIDAFMHSNWCYKSEKLLPLLIFHQYLYIDPKLSAENVTEIVDLKRKTKNAG